MCFYWHVVLLFHSVFPHAFRNGPARFRILRKTGDMLHHTFVSCCKYIPLVLSCLTHVTHEDFRHAVVHIATWGQRKGTKASWAKSDVYWEKYMARLFECHFFNWNKLQFDVADRLTAAFHETAVSTLCSQYFSCEIQSDPTERVSVEPFCNHLIVPRPFLPCSCPCLFNTQSMMNISKHLFYREKKYTTRKWLSQMRTYPRKSYSYVMSKHTLGGLGPLLLCHHNKP